MSLSEPLQGELHCKVHRRIEQVQEARDSSPTKHIKKQEPVIEPSDTDNLRKLHCMII